MSYGVAEALQAAVYQALLADSQVAGLSAGAVYDAVPSGAVPDTFVSLGPETALDRSDGSGGGAEHRIEVSVTTTLAGFAGAKALAVAVSDALDGADLSLSRGRLVFLKFDRAVAKREGIENRRRIDLRFRARVEDN